MNVRPATTEDVDAIREVARETWHAAYDDIIGSDAVDDQVAEWYAPDVVEDGVTREGWPYLVADDGGTVVGYAGGGASDAEPADAVLAAIYVRPERWGEGIGSALLAAVHDRLRADGHGSVWLAVLADNDVAVSFYEGHGYEVIERRRTEVGGVETTELVMRRSL